jgi:hypothetical protein
MGRAFTIALHYLAVSFVLAMGLNFSGCGDSATVNPVVELASLTVTPGTLQPAFNGGTTQYKVDLSNNVTSVTMTAQPAVAGDTVTINGQVTTSRVITLDAEGPTTPVNIVVSESGTNSRTYTVLLTKAGLTGNNSLRSLGISPGSLDPGFNANTLSYEVSVGSSVPNIRLTPTLDDSSATMTVNGQAAPSGQAQTIPLRDPGLSTILTITVTAQNGTPKTYTVVVARAALGGNNNLQSLTVSPSGLSPSFRSDRTVYALNVGGRVETVTVTATLQESNSSLTINGTPARSGQARSISLRPDGSSTEIQIIVSAPNGSQKPYVITVNRAELSSDNNLEALDVTPGTLEPEFSPGTETYAVDVAHTVTNVTVTATKSDPNAVLSGDVPNGGRATIQLDGPGTSKTVSMTVTAPDGSPKTYRVTVNRLVPSSDNNLSSLTVAPGSLSPGFSPNVLNYEVSSSAGSLTVSATKSDPDAVMSGSLSAGTGVATGQATIPLGGTGAITRISIIVRAPNGTSKNYTVTVSRPFR